MLDELLIWHPKMKDKNAENGLPNLKAEYHLDFPKLIRSQEMIAFTASRVSVDEDEYTLIAGIASGDLVRYVTFQRGTQLGDAELGVHFEINDQIYGKHDSIRVCIVSRERLAVKLIEPIDWQEQQITTIDVKLETTNVKFGLFVAMLRRIFRGFESSLIIVD